MNRYLQAWFPFLTACTVFYFASFIPLNPHRSVGESTDIVTALFGLFIIHFIYFGVAIGVCLVFLIQAITQTSRLLMSNSHLTKIN